MSSVQSLDCRLSQNTFAVCVLSASSEKAWMTYCYGRLEVVLTSLRDYKKLPTSLLIFPVQSVTIPYSQSLPQSRIHQSNLVLDDNDTLFPNGASQVLALFPWQSIICLGMRKVRRSDVTNSRQAQKHASLVSLLVWRSGTSFPEGQCRLLPQCDGSSEYGE